jgi:L-alanine-DL-glutamate epimerase-like enolase superfamily enzyme
VVLPEQDREHNLKITDVRACHLAYPLQQPIETSFGRMTTRAVVLVFIDTDAGITGMGETWTNYPAWAPEERLLTIERGLKPLLLREDPLDIAFLWNKLHGALMRSGAGLQWGATGPLMQAISGVDIALWDILGRTLDAPIFRLLGGAGGRRVPAYACGLGPQGHEPLVEAALAQGFQTFKLKVGFGLVRDRENLRILRQMIGPDRRLAIDANQAWQSADDAIRHLEHYRAFDPLFIEEPVPAAQVQDLCRIRERQLMPLSGGENLYGRRAFRESLTAGALDIVQPDVTKTGGISEARLICQMADAWGLPYAPHMFGTAVGLAASLHILSATPNGLFMEVDANPNGLRTELLQDAFFDLHEGAFVIRSDRPGLGITLDESFVREYAVGPRVG